jgi:hypothetical protein
MKRLFRHRLLVGGVALLVAGSAGGAYAATQSGGNSRQAFLNDVAKRLNVPPSELRSAVRGALLDRLNAAVKAGELTQAQADRIKKRIEQGGGFPLGPIRGPFGFRHFGPGGPDRHFGPDRGLMRHSLLSSAASYLGVDTAQLFSDLQAGKSLAEVAQARHKSVPGLEQALVAAAKARLGKLVASGFLTEAQEQRVLNRLNARIDRLVNAHPRFIRRNWDTPPPGDAPPLPAPSFGGPGAPPPPGV